MFAVMQQRSEVIMKLFSHIKYKYNKFHDTRSGDKLRGRISGKTTDTAPGIIAEYQVLLKVQISGPVPFSWSA
jgi:hypothetical protein